MMLRPPDSLPFSGDPDADRLIAHDPLALLIGFLLDQQVTVQKAFAGPLELQRRVGSLEAATLAAMDPADLLSAFRTPPALHRYPADMARRTQALCAAVTADYGGDAARIWMEASDGPELRRRLLGLPGIGETKAATIMAILARRYGLRLPGLEALSSSGPSLADVDSAEALAAYQAQKRARRQATREGRAAPTG
jgi:uncharacterized HhH-GPD family protein